MILQLNPPLWMRTERGVGLAHFVIDYGPEHDLLWVMFYDKTGECWCEPNRAVRMIPNYSLEAPRADATTS